MGSAAISRASRLVWTLAAIALARRAKPSRRAFSVGAILLGPDGKPLGSGYSRETGPNAHAEEVAIRRAGREIPKGSVLFTSMEPCGRRLSGRRSCAERVVAAGIRVVVAAADEPPVFVPATGFRALRRARVRVVRVPELAADALGPNAHLLRAPRRSALRGSRTRRRSRRPDG